MRAGWPGRSLGRDTEERGGWPLGGRASARAGAGERLAVGAAFWGAKGRRARTARLWPRSRSWAGGLGEGPLCSSWGDIPGISGHTERRRSPVVPRATALRGTLETGPRPPCTARPMSSRRPLPRPAAEVTQAWASQRLSGRPEPEDPAGRAEAGEGLGRGRASSPETACSHSGCGTWDVSTLLTQTGAGAGVADA